MRRAFVFRDIVFAISVAVLLCIAYLFKDMDITNVRNGEEYCQTFLDGEVIEQEIFLKHTPSIGVSVLPFYSQPAPNVGLNYSLIMGAEKREGFIPLSTLTDREWNVTNISTENLNYVGTARLTIETVGLDEANCIQLLITTNTLQLNPENKLFVNGEQIINGRLCTEYKIFKLETIPFLFATICAIAFVISILYPIIEMNFRAYPAIWVTFALISTNLIISYPSLYDTSKHVTAQYFFTWQNLGFVRRAFVGTIIELLGVNFTKGKYVLYGIACIIILFILELFILYDKHHISQRRAMEKCYLLFCCLPFTATTLFGVCFFARLDELLIIAFLLSCLVIIKERGIFLIPLFTTMAILTHEMYVALFVPFVFCLLLYKWYLTRKQKYLLWLIVSSIIAICLGVYIGFIAKPQIPFETAWANMLALGDADMIWDALLNFDMYASTSALRADSVRVILVTNTIPKMIITGFLLTPIIYLAIRWISVLFVSQESLLGKSIVLLFPCTFVGLVLCMCLMCDWGRLFVCYGIGIFFSFLTIWSMDANRIRGITLKIWETQLERFGGVMVWGICLLYLFASTWERGATTAGLFPFFWRLS